MKNIFRFLLGVLVFLTVSGGAVWAYRSWKAQAEIMLPPSDWLTPFPTYLPYASPTATATATMTPTPSPTATPTPSPSPLPSPIPTLTPPALAFLTADGNLYCRTGPGPFYSVVALLQPGDQAQVLGQAPGPGGEGRYWFLRLLDTRACWVPDRYVVVGGAYDEVEAFPTPAPPPVAFTIGFAGQAECGNRRGWLFQITNYGTKIIESVRVSVHGNGGGVYEAPVYIEWWRDCSTRGGAPLIKPGRSLLVTVLVPGPGTGKTFNGTAKACANDHLQEPCAEQSFSFRP